MSRPRAAWLLPIVLAHGCATPSVSHDTTTVSAIGRELDSIVVTALKERHIPGLALTVLKDDDTLLSRGYGRPDIEGTGTVSDTTVFELGSISKQFLAALVLAMDEDGRLSLDDSVTRYLPNFPRLPRDLRVVHLLNHTSGLRELFTFPEAQAAFDDLTRSRGELEAFVRQIPVDFPPGSRWSYSNTNYTLLALLVERITGKDYEEALAERLFQPLGLSSLRQCSSLPEGPEARGHELSDGAIIAAGPENMNWIRGDGGLCGSASDVARWTRLLATGRVVAPELYRRMIAPTRLADGREADYGLGLSLVPLGASRRIGHNGAMRGFSATVAYYPDAALTVAVLVNRGDVRTESIESAIARRVLGLPRPELPECPLSADERRRYVGTYDIGVFHVRVLERGGQLWLEAPRPGPNTALRYLCDREFAGEIDTDAYRATFSGKDGPMESLRLLMGGMYWYGSRRP